MNRQITGHALLIVALVLTFTTDRLVAIPPLLAIWVAWLVFRRRAQGSLVFSAVAVALFLAANLQPYDFRFNGFQDEPRVVAIRYGYPGQETLRMAKRGDVCLGGCRVSWNAPRYFVIW